MRRVGDYWTETERVDRDENGRATALHRTVCCCAAAGSTRRGCAIVAGNQTPCRCACHARMARAGLQRPQATQATPAAESRTEREEAE